MTALCSAVLLGPTDKTLLCFEHCKVKILNIFSNNKVIWETSVLEMCN